MARRQRHRRRRRRRSTPRRCAAASRGWCGSTRRPWRSGRPRARRASATTATGSRRPGPRSPWSSAHSSQIVMPRSCSQRTLVSPRRNHSSSPMIDRRCTFLVVTSGKPSVRSNRIWWPNTLRVPVPVRSALSTPWSGRGRAGRGTAARPEPTGRDRPAGVRPGWSVATTRAPGGTTLAGMTSSPFGRVLTAMVTPMSRGGEIDDKGTDSPRDHLLATGHDGIVVSGTTGESARPPSTRARAGAAASSARGDRAKVVAGVGSNDTGTPCRSPATPRMPVPTPCSSSRRTTTSPPRPASSRTSGPSPTPPACR